MAIFQSVMNNMEEDNKQSLDEVNKITSLNIQDLPEEVFEIIARFLPGKDLDNCFHVCKKWRRILNHDKFWKKVCRYPKKYFILSSGQVGGTKSCKSSTELCEWRNYFLLQKCMWENWRRGKFIKSKSGINLRNISFLMDLVDSHGNHWLFDSGEEGITIWNITDTPAFHSKCDYNDHLEVLPMNDKVLACRSNYVKVFQFKHPEYELKLDYRFKIERNDVLPEHEVVPSDEYFSGVRFIVVDNRYFIGYSENITNIRSVFIHIWDLNSANKIATQNVIQESFMDFIRSVRGSDVTNDFSGGLLLFSGDDGRFLVTLIDDKFKLCHISLFTLKEMRFVNVIAHFESRTAWCFMKGDIVVIYHILRENKSQLSVYDVSGNFLAKLDFPADYNPAFTHELWFEGCKVILKVKKTINVLTVVDKDNNKVCKKDFKLDKERFILKYFDPNFLLLFNRGCQFSEYSVSVWDTESGMKLWKFEKFSSVFVFQQMINRFEYPGRLLVQFKEDREISILNFDQYGT